MRVLAAYLLATLGGNGSPAVGDLEKILSSVGIELDAEGKERAEALIKDLAGKDLAEVIREGETKLSSAPMAGGAAPAAAAGGAAAAPVEAEKEPEPEEESDGDMGMDLFGGDDDDY
jgi:large subunit ribosomal protein LP2